MSDKRILNLVSCLAAAIFIACIGIQAFMFERLDPDGASDENALRWAQYASDTRSFKALAVLSAALSISCGIAALASKTQKQGRIPSNNEDLPFLS